MAEARITEVCDAVLAFLAGAITPPLAPPDRVAGAYAATDVLETLDGKTVRVFPAGYKDAQRLARNRVQPEYRVAVVTEIPYLGAGSPSPDGAVPPEWVRAQIAWVDANVYGPLNRAHVRRAEGLLLDALTCWECEVTTVYDPVRLAEERLFVSIVEVAYREGSEG